MMTYDARLWACTLFTRTLNWPPYPGGGIGRRDGLKHRCPQAVWVQVPPRVPTLYFHVPNNHSFAKKDEWCRVPKHVQVVN